jgi:hypothetical protein
MHMKIMRYLIGNISVTDNVKKIKVDAIRKFVSIEPVSCHTAEGAAAAVFKNYLWCMGRILFYIF